MLVVLLYVVDDGADVKVIEGVVMLPVKVVAPMVSENVTPEQFVPPIVSVSPKARQSIEFALRPPAIDAVPRIAVGKVARPMSTEVHEPPPTLNLSDTVLTDPHLIVPVVEMSMLLAAVP